MTKKFIVVLLAIFLLLSTSYVFAANNELGDSANKTSNTVRNVVGGAENVVEDAAGAIGTGVRDLGNTFTDGAARVRDNGNDGYDATRTATARTANDNTFLGMNSTTWTWFVLAIAAIAIVGLVWYYAMQNDTNRVNNDNH